jgi:hypothetical protein
MEFVNRAVSGILPDTQGQGATPLGFFRPGKMPDTTGDVNSRR